MSERPGDTRDSDKAFVGCGCLSSLAVAVISGSLVGVLGASAGSTLSSSLFMPLIMLLLLSLLFGVLFFALAVTKDRTETIPTQSNTSSYRPSNQDGGVGGHSVPVSLHELRAMPYQEYLQTPHWKRRREAKLRAAGHRCQVCNRGSKSLDVHHRTYERLGQEQDGDLTVLCRACHNIFHEHGRLGG